MRFTHKDEQEKKLRKLAREHIEAWKATRDSGEWVDVEPYQHGWIRYFDLREDIKNREDVVDIRRALHLINNQKYCRKKDFLAYDWKTKKEKPMEQHICMLSPEKYVELDEKLKSYFSKQLILDVVRYPYPRRMMVTKYVFKYDFWFEFVVEPNIIIRHWIPDSVAESRYAEIKNNINTNNLWPKIDRVLGVKNHHRYDINWLQDKYGNSMSDVDFEVEESLRDVG